MIDLVHVRRASVDWEFGDLSGLFRHGLTSFDPAAAALFGEIGLPPGPGLLTTLDLRPGGGLGDTMIVDVRACDPEILTWPIWKRVESHVEVACRLSDCSDDIRRDTSSLTFSQAMIEQVSRFPMGVRLRSHYAIAELPGCLLYEPHQEYTPTRLHVWRGRRLQALNVHVSESILMHSGMARGLPLIVLGTLFERIAGLFPSSEFVVEPVRAL